MRQISWDSDVKIGRLIFIYVAGTLLVMVMVMCPYTAERRDVLENTLPEAQEISQGPRGAKSPPEGNLEG